MSSLEVVKPQVIEGIEFYVSSDGSECGVSLAGLARLCGVNVSTISRLVNDLVLHKTGIKQLEPLCGKVLSICIASPASRSGSPNPVVNAKAAARIIRYYAYESKAANDTAKHSYDKFAEIGVESWIKQITGYHQESQPELSQVMQAIQQLTSQVQVMSTHVEELKGIRKVTVHVYPGLDKMLDKFSDINALAPSEATMTIKEFLATKGVTLDKVGSIRVGQIASESYKSLTGNLPKPVKRYVKGKGYMPAGMGYSLEHIPLLEASLQTYLSSIS